MIQKYSNAWWQQKYKSKRQSSAKRGLAFEIPFLDYKRLMSAGRCYFTGVKLTENTVSIDRINNHLGYVKGNVASCHTTFNSRKNDLTPQEIEAMYKRLKECGAYSKVYDFRFFSIQFK